MHPAWENLVTGIEFSKKTDLKKQNIKHYLEIWFYTWIPVTH